MPDNDQDGYVPGRRLNETYLVRALLGRGGLGEVYLVEHLVTGDLRAAKVIRAPTESSIDDLCAFRQEALTMLNLGAHPFVVQLHEILELGRNTALVMQYIPPSHGCTTIQDYIQHTRDYTDRQLGAWAVEFCVGMEHALANGMEAHRDIKPANLLVGTDGFVKIADFGLAKAANRTRHLIRDSELEPKLFQSLESVAGRRVCGTPGYIAPELLLGEQPSPMCDLFSFGVTFWQLAARSMELPFPVVFRGDVAAYQESVLRRAIAGDVRPVDSPFFPLILRCLRADPAQRYANFPALRKAIKEAVQGTGDVPVDFIVNQGFRGTFDDYVSRGRAFLALGRRNRALRILDRALQLDPQSARALEARGETLYERGDASGALRDFKAARLLSPDWDAPLLGMAKVLLDSGEVDLAEQQLTLVLGRNPRNLDALLQMSAIEGRRGHAEQARKLLGEAIAAAPDHALAHEFEGRLRWEEENLIGAATSLQRSLSINPLNTEARLALAAVLTDAGQIDAAGQQYQLAQGLHHGDAEGLNRIAVHMSENRNAETAIKLFRELATLEPGSLAVMLVNIGNAQINLGDEAAAEASFKEALIADPAYALAYRRLGNLEDWHQNHGQAAAYYERACVYEPDNPLNLSSAGTAYLRVDAPERAREYLSASIRLLPEQPQILYNLAVAHCQCDDPDAALERLSEAVRMDRQYSSAWFLKAQIELHLGRAKDAAHSVQAALSVDPSIPDDKAQALQAFAREHRLDL